MSTTAGQETPGAADADAVTAPIRRVSDPPTRPLPAVKPARQQPARPQQAAAPRQGKAPAAAPAGGQDQGQGAGRFRQTLASPQAGRVADQASGLVVAMFAYPLVLHLLLGGPGRMWGWVKAKFINQPYTAGTAGPARKAGPAAPAQPPLLGPAPAPPIGVLR